MKVKLEKNYKEYYTMADLDRAKMLIAMAKEDEATAKEYAVMAVREALKGTGDFPVEILKAEATTAKNCRVWDRYADCSRDMDILLDIIAKTDFGFIEVTAYLTDIWETSSENRTYDKMFIRYYGKKEIERR